MEQPWNQQREGGVYAVAESCHADLEQAGLCEVHGALLMMELMEEDLLPSFDLLLDGGDGDRQLSYVIRSLEAEISDGDHQPAVMMTGDDGAQRLTRIEGVLSDDMDGYDFEGASSFGYDEAEGWCMYTNNAYEGGSVLGYYDDDTTVDHHQYYYCCAEGSADHMYLPLWE